ncbi:MAG: hypothetical protein K2M70_12220 [Lachnospiraceae bacterium]|nr:hypothetical protein [Lachnospiraceae bacterium]
MEQYAQNLVYTDEEKVITYCKNIIKAVEKTRDVAAQSKLKSRKIEEALQTKDKQTMWNVLQEYIHKHSELFTMANGVLLGRVDVDFYENVSEEDVAKQLEIVMGLIYLNEAKCCVAKETIKACFKKLLKQSDIFSDHEIELLLL